MVQTWVRLAGDPRDRTGCELHRVEADLRARFRGRGRILEELIHEQTGSLGRAF